MSLRSPIVYLCASLFLVGCSDQLAPDTTTPLVPTAAVKAPKQGELGVMSYNLYVGADLDQVIGALVNADPADDFPALLNAIDVLGQTDYPSRVEAIADAILKGAPLSFQVRPIAVFRYWNELVVDNAIVAACEADRKVSVRSGPL